MWLVERECFEEAGTGKQKGKEVPRRIAGKVFSLAIDLHLTFLIFFFFFVVEVSRVQKASLFENSLQLAVNFCLLDLLITLICVSLSGSEIWSHWLKCFFSYFMKFSIMTSLTSSAQLSASRSSGIPFTWPSLRM